MFIESLVLDRHKGMGEIVRDHIAGDGNSVGICRDQLGDLIVVRIIYKGRKSLRADVDDRLVRRAVYDSAKDTDPQADACYTEPDDAHQKELSYTEQDLFHPLAALRCKVILPAAYSSSAKIHIMNLFLSVCKCRPLCRH